jgi:GNAT superfamily N-acetyltransferase
MFAIKSFMPSMLKYPALSRCLGIARAEPFKYLDRIRHEGFSSRQRPDEASSSVSHLTDAIDVTDAADARFRCASATPFSNIDNKTVAHDLGRLKTVEGPVTLKDGTVARICVLTDGDAGLMQKFHDGLSFGCRQKLVQDYDLGHLSAQERATFTAPATALKGGTGFVNIGAKVDDTDGKEKIIGLSSYSPIWLNHGGIGRPVDTVVAEEYRGKGVAKAIKRAQIDCLRMEGFKGMRCKSADPALQGAVKGAAAELGLEVTEMKWELYPHYFEKFLYIDFESKRNN